MEFYRFDKEVGRNITMFDSDFVMSRIINTDKPVHIGCMHLDANGCIGYHQAVTPQLLLILNGEGWVRGETEERFIVKAGDAVFWEKNEWHETITSEGLTAVVIESEELSPASYMKLKSNM